MYVAKVQNHTVMITDTATGQVIRQIMCTGVSESEVRIDGQEVALPDGNGQTSIYDIPSGVVVRTV